METPGPFLMLDEPDAHLEILRQRQVYKMLLESSERSATQLLIASHSEVLLNEAAERDVVVSFVGQPHRIDDRGTQTLKALSVIGFEDYYQAEQTGWILYLEGSTDLAILDAFAQTLDHKAAMRALVRPFVHYIGNQFSKSAGSLPRPPGGSCRPERIRVTGQAGKAANSCGPAPRRPCVDAKRDRELSVPARNH